MNLLQDKWIPVRQIKQNSSTKIALLELLSSKEAYIPCLPRDDMELALLQLLVCLVQVMAIPQNMSVLIQRSRQPLTKAEYEKISAPLIDWFDLQSPDYPCLQVKGVIATQPTKMDKLLTGVTGATNCAFVNEPNQGDALCPGCTAIVLFNQANNAPGFGGGFKAGLRGSNPITTLLYDGGASGYGDLRKTIWLNVLTEESLDACQPTDWRKGLHQAPTWVELIKAEETIATDRIGLLRGLFWQPAHVELCLPIGEGKCSHCGQIESQRYQGFNKEKFNFTVAGLWPHPHSPYLLIDNKGVIEDKFLSFTTEAPAWSQLGKVVVFRESSSKQRGQRPAEVIKQFKDWAAAREIPTRLNMGGYRINQASILDRRHEVFNFSPDWAIYTDNIEQLVTIGLGYKSALRSALYIFDEGIKKTPIKGAGIKLHLTTESHYFSQSSPIIVQAFSQIGQSNFQHKILTDVQLYLTQICQTLFQQAVSPYIHHPVLFRSYAIARRRLMKLLNELKPQQGVSDEPKNSSNSTI